LSIGRKLLLGFLCYGVLTFLIALFALSNLDELNEINYRIIQRDIPLVELADKITENLLAHATLASRPLILQNPDLEVLFWKRNEEVKKLLLQFRMLPQPETLPVAQLTALHEEYTQTFKQDLKRREDGPLSGRESEKRIKAIREEMIQLLKKTSSAARQDQVKKNQMISEIGSRASRVIAGLSVAGILLGVLVALVITRNISGPIEQLKLSTKEISEGKFDHVPAVRSWDELGDLSHAFHEMTIRLKHLEEMHLDANPLTRLPGGAAIEAFLKKKIAEDSPLAFCLADLRNFKAFNDQYGYARGNEVILATAEMIKQAVREHGGEGDFVGHIGGDDFVLITLPDRYERICTAVIADFDQKIAAFYDPEDRQKGYIQEKTRKGEVVSFPIMTISIAVATNQKRKLKNPIQAGEIAAEMKNYAKSFSRSIFVVDQRTDPSPEGDPKTPAQREDPGGPPKFGMGIEKENP
jgi:diguanylate cyclase (GGDEF)-like protein